MKKRGFGIKVLLLATLILVIAICLFLFIKNDKFSIIINFYKNEEQVNNIVKKISTYNYIMIRKNTNNYEIFTNEYDSFYDEINVPKQFKNIALFMKNNKIDMIFKEKQNYAIIYKAQFNYSRGIVLLNDENSYKYSHKIVNKKNLKGNWFYVEGK